jgi:hypothetical protein
LAFSHKNDILRLGSDVKEVIMVLELDEKEKKVLKQVLESFETELRGEIVKTDIKEFRETLHEEEEVVKDLLKKVA